MRTRRSRARTPWPETTRPTQWKAKARAAGDAIADPEEREHFDEDYATL